ncbi:glutamate-rich protein 4 [Tamandua tetradactyla]|uniref:glutamate-rich protein 4 n=1 Tax=Tamandua tetradactyla TaxID=48850 RepID=UPI004053C96F
MEVWRELRQAGLLPTGLGPLPRALRGVPPAGMPDQTLVSPGAEPRGARESLLWIWEELGTLRRVDVQLLGQLCGLWLEIGALREELAAVLEEEEEASSEEDLEKENEPQGNWGGGDLQATCPAPPPRLPDFEMTI